MEKILIDVNEEEINNYLSKGWTIKSFKTTVLKDNEEHDGSSRIALTVVLQINDDEFLNLKTQEEESQTSEMKKNQTHNYPAEPLIIERDIPKCLDPGCTRMACKDGLCYTHYYKKHGHL